MKNKYRSRKCFHIHAIYIFNEISIDWYDPILSVFYSIINWPYFLIPLPITIEIETKQCIFSNKRPFAIRKIFYCFYYFILFVSSAFIFNAYYNIVQLLQLAAIFDNIIHKLNHYIVSIWLSWKSTDSVTQVTQILNSTDVNCKKASCWRALLRADFNLFIVIIGCIGLCDIYWLQLDFWILHFAVRKERYTDTDDKIKYWMLDNCVYLNVIYICLFMFSN